MTDAQATEAIRYLEFCVNTLNSEDQSVHDNLLTLYLQHKPDRLLEYVKDRKVTCFIFQMFGFLLFSGVLKLN